MSGVPLWEATGGLQFGMFRYAVDDGGLGDDASTGSLLQPGRRKCRLQEQLKRRPRELMQAQ